MDKEEKLKKLERELKKAERGLRHMEKEFVATRGGSAYGVEYYNIQIWVYGTMVREIKEEILKVKKGGRIL